MGSLEGLGIYAIVLGLIWAVYGLRRRGAHHRALSTLVDSQESGLMQPASLHPLIDPSKCLGCAACADACP